MTITGSQMRISSSSLKIQILDLILKERTAEQESLLLMMISQVKLVSKKPKASKLLPVKKN